jgi:hypothetical protein
MVEEKLGKLYKKALLIKIEHPDSKNFPNKDLEMFSTFLKKFNFSVRSCRNPTYDSLSQLLADIR